MNRGKKRTLAIVAVTGAALLVSGSVVTFSATVIGEQLVAMQQADGTALPGNPAGDAQEVSSINREAKGDKLPVANGETVRTKIRSVEVIGLSNASIVYRDRDGNILYRTDPLANVTVVSKNIELPEVTIRETEAAEVERIPVEEASPDTRPHGCESAFARPSPESLTRMSSRCVTDISAPMHVAEKRTALP